MRPCLSLLLLATTWQPAPGLAQVPLWPGAVPGALPNRGAETEGVETKKLVGGKPWRYVGNVTKPTLTVYPPKGRNTGAAVVVFPGGGYTILAIDLEGTEVCDWLASRGITAVLCKYRVPGVDHEYPKSAPYPMSGPYPRTPYALADAQRTLRLCRANAAKWGFDPHKVGVLGFSAGGHLVAATSHHFDHPIYRPVDAVDRQSARPDFGVALYPGKLWSGRPAVELRQEVTITKKAPPQFILQAEDDPVDDIRNGLSYFTALKLAGVPAELHVYAKGGHAFGLRRSANPITGWPALVEAWLHTLGMI